MSLPATVKGVGLSAVELVVFWLPLALLAIALLAYGIRRDRGRPTRAAVAVAAACALVLAVTTAVAGWGAYEQRRAEQDACTPSADC